MSAAAFSVSAQDEKKPTAAEIDLAVARIAALVEENYVFPVKGKAIAADFTDAHRRGKFKNAPDWTEFGRLATERLLAASGDGHMYVRFDPEKTRELAAAPPKSENPETPPAENPFYYNQRARDKNYGFTEVKIFEDGVGYLKISEINLSEKSLPILFAAMRFVAESKALIIDLRGNGGGGSNVGAVFESFFLPKNVALLEFKDRRGTIETAATVRWLTEPKYAAPVYIIVDKRTASAAEAFAFALQTQKRASIVGQTSAGAAHMNSWYAVNEQIYVSVSTGAPVIPGTEISWEAKGITPDFAAAPGEEIEFIRRKIGETVKTANGER